MRGGQVRAKSRTKFVVIAAAIAIVLSSPVIWVLTHYSSHALPRTTVAGVSVDGMSRDQVAQTLGSMAAGRSAAIALPTGDVADFGLEDLGVTVNAQQSVEQVFSDSTSVKARVGGLFKDREIEPVIEVDQRQLTEALSKIEDPELKDPVDPYVEFSSDAQQYVVKKGEPGVSIDVEKLTEDLTNAALGKSSGPITMGYAPLDPQIPLDAAQQAASRANDLLMLDVTASVASADPVRASAEEKSKWITFALEGTNIEPVIDQQMVRDWLSAVGQPATSPGRARVENLDSAGNVVLEVDPGRPGTQVVNADEAAEQISEALAAGTPVSVEVQLGEVAPEVVQLELPGHDKALPYAPASGEKWFDVDITNARMTAYEGTTPVMIVPTVPGADLTPTVEGVFKTYIKYEAEDMAGLNVDGSPWAYAAVPYVMYFHELWAIHGAYWRDDFGTYQPESGSHGCVNVSPEVAKKLFEWAPVGTTVVSHR